jgi:hypothetical protein
VDAVLAHGEAQHVTLLLALEDPVAEGDPELVGHQLVSVGVDGEGWHAQSILYLARVSSYSLL